MKEQDPIAVRGAGPYLPAAKQGAVGRSDVELFAVRSDARERAVGSRDTFWRQRPPGRMKCAWTNQLAHDTRRERRKQQDSQRGPPGEAHRNL